MRAVVGCETVAALVVCAKQWRRGESVPVEVIPQLVCRHSVVADPATQTSHAPTLPAGSSPLLPPFSHLWATAPSGILDPTLETKPFCIDPSIGSPRASAARSLAR